MHKITLEGAMSSYRKIIEDYHYLISRGGAECAAIHDRMPEAVNKYRDEIYKCLKRTVRQQLAEEPAYSAIMSRAAPSKEELAELRVRLGRIVFYTKDDNEIAKVAVTVSYGGGSGNDLEFIFEKSAEETANEITGAIFNRSTKVLRTSV